MRLRSIAKSSLVAILLSAIFAVSSTATGTKYSQNIPQGVFGYMESVGEKKSPFNWQAKKDNGLILVRVFEENKKFLNYCTKSGETLEWRIEVENKHDITAERKGNTLHIHGTRFGEPYDTRVEIDERPWYQPLSFSLGSFLDSDKQKISFWVIRADKIKVIALTAEKMGVEPLTFNDKEVSTQKVEIRAEGFYSKFWSASYWYRKSDNLFLRYQSVHGGPGTAETTVRLVSVPNSDIKTNS